MPPNLNSGPPEPQPSQGGPAVPWWAVVLLVTIAVAAYVVLVVIGNEDGTSTATALGGLLTGTLAVLGLSRKP